MLKSNELDLIARQPLYFSFTELARLHLDQNNFSQASNYFQKAFTEFDKINARQQAPIAYANVLQEYSISLQREGQMGKAEKLLMDSIDIRQNNSSGFSITDRTPYGTECD